LCGRRWAETAACCMLHPIAERDGSLKGRMRCGGRADSSEDRGKVKPKGARRVWFDCDIIRMKNIRISPQAIKDQSGNMCYSSSQLMTTDAVCLWCACTSTSITCLPAIEQRRMKEDGGAGADHRTAAEELEDAEAVLDDVGRRVAGHNGALKVMGCSVAEVDLDFPDTILRVPRKDFPRRAAHGWATRSLTCSISIVRN
jgi:hypothetical protein